MTPSQLSIVVKSDGISKATDELNKLAQAGISVDKETKDLIIASAKLSAEQAKAATASAKLQTELKRQELVISRIAATEQAAADAHARSAQIMQAAEEKKSAAIERTSTREEAAAIKKSMQDQAQIQAYGRMQAAANEMNRKFDEKKKKLEEVTSKGNVYVNTLRSMATAASAYVGVNFVKGLFEQADAWGMMQSKLSLATGGMQSAKVIQEDLFKTAQAIRIPLEDTAKLYNRLVNPLMMMGKSSKETGDMVSAMGYALKLSGATGQEAASAMLQFSQSMNAGRLNGGEFNSVAEASPNILRAIETELRATGRGAELAQKGLKKMAGEGLLTAELVSNAMLRALPKWQKDFEKLPITVDGALIRIRNMWEKAIGTLAQDTGFSKNFTQLLSQLEQGIPSFAKSVVSAMTTAIEYAGLLFKSFVAITSVGLATWAFEALWGTKGLVAGLNAAQVASKAMAGTMAMLNSTAGVFGIIALGVWAIVEAYGKLNQERATLQSLSAEALSSNQETMKRLEAETSMLIQQVNLIREKRGETSKLIDPYQKQDEVVQSLNKSFTKRQELLQAIEKTQTEITRLEGTAGQGSEGQEMARLNRIEKLRASVQDAQKQVKNLEYEETEINAKIAVNNIVKKKAEKEIASERRTNALDRLKQLTQEKDKAEEVYQSTLKQIDLYRKSNTISQEDADKYISLAKKLRDADKEHVKTAKEVNEIMAVKAQISAITAEELLDLDKKKIESSIKYTKNLDDQLATVQQQIDQTKLLITTEESKAQASLDVAIAEAEAQKAGRDGVLLTGEQLVKTQQLIDKLRELKELKGVKEQQDEYAKQADKYESAYQAANKKIQDGLYNAIGKGGGNAIKKLIEDIKSWFARLVLSPIIEPISAIGASIISPNAASAMSFSQGLSNLGSTASSAMNFLSNPTAWGSKVSASIANGIGTVGTTLGSGFLSSVSAGMSGMALEQASAAGVSSSLGFSIGSGLSAITPYLPYIAAVGLLAKGLSMGDKQMTGQTVTGNLGTNDLSRNVSWTQQGGFLRKDRSGTWSYNLANSTAIQDGRAYQDTASMSSDKALLDQLNLMYSALKTSTADMAKSLNLSADEILKRNDAINFAFGKDAQETSSNITKAFESIANAMSKDLLGGLISLAKVGESSSQTLMRLSTTIGSVNNIFKVLGYKLFDINEAGIKSADALVTLYGGLDKFQSLTQSYYDNFYKESEKTEKALKVVKEAIKSLGITDEVKTREDFRAQVDKAQKAGNDALVKSLLELSNAFAQVVDWSQQAATSLEEMTYQGDVADMPSLQGVLDSVVEGIKKLASEAERWYNIRNQASSMQSSIDDVIGNPKKDPSIRMRQLWDAMAKDISPEQKLSLAGELKDLIISKYQVEKDSLTKLIDFGKQLRGYVDTLKVGSLSPLTMTDKLLEAKAQYESTLAKAQGGDTAAQGALQGKSEAYLQLAQTAFASSSAYVDIFNSVTSSLDSLGIESMSAADRTISLSESQLTELQRLKDFINAIEVSSNSYYEASLTAMYEQTKIANDLFARLGNLEGLTPILSGLPAEIAAALNGKANEEWVRNLYSTMAGKTGNAVDSQGLDYWMKEVDTYGKAYVQTAFQNSVNTVKAMAPSPMFANNQSQDSNSVVQEELRALKEELAKQTAVLAETILTSNQDNANTIVNGTNQNNAQSSWMKETMPTLN